MANQYTKRKTELKQIQTNQKLETISIDDILNHSQYIQDDWVKENMIYIANLLIQQNRLKKVDMIKFISIFEMLEMITDLKMKIKNEKYNTKYIQSYTKLIVLVNEYLSYFNLMLVDNIQSQHPAIQLLMNE